MRARLLAFVVLIAAAPASAQISPGPLARAHDSLDGSTNCAKCHGLRREPMSGLCLDCHKDIRWYVDRRRGLHAREGNPAKKACASCHPDHAGLGFALIAWPGGSTTRFDHAGAGWLLEGKHAKAKCESCHTSKFRTGPAVALSKRRAGAGWLGLETSCVACHRDDDVHKSSLGAKCENCHDARTWTKAPTFDHAKSEYPLTGKHSDVACDKCHLTAKLVPVANVDGKRIPLFKPVPHKECSACHEDTHRGRLGPKCGDCHNTRGFLAVDRKGFNHDITRYALAGKHRSVKCEGCHGANLSKRAPAYSTCGACHIDVHVGEATLKGAVVDCAACHRVEGFAPATFTVAQHRETRYALQGKHAQVACASCHTPVPSSPNAGAQGVPARPKAVGRIRLPFANCASCHADTPHGDQLRARADRGACDACHAESGWTPSTYTRAAHARLRLALDGRHAAIACGACHRSDRSGLPAFTTSGVGTAQVRFAIAERECEQCHVDPHVGRFGAKGRRPTTGGCRGCHSTESFRPAAIDVAAHAKYAFALDGAHRATPCVSCHEEMKAAAATSTLLLAPRGVTPFPFAANRAPVCVSCHEDVHGAQLATRNDRGACESCHATDHFTPASRFVHDRDAAFPLAGAHAKVACAACHRADPSLGPRAPVRYRPLSSACESCHARTPTRSVK